MTATTLAHCKPFGASQHSEHDPVHGPSAGSVQELLAGLAALRRDAAQQAVQTHLSALPLLSAASDVIWRVVGFRKRYTAILAAVDAKLRQTANARNGALKMHGPGAAGWGGVLRNNFPDLMLTSRCHLSLPTKQARGSVTTIVVATRTQPEIDHGSLRAQELWCPIWTVPRQR